MQETQQQSRLETMELGGPGLGTTRVGFGAWAGGGGWEFGWGPQGDEESIAAIQRALELVADTSHDLRTPLTAIRINLEVLELHDDMPAEDRRRILAEGTEELRKMTNLIDELVELGRGDSQTPTTEPTRLDLITEEAIAIAARRSGLDIHLEASPAVVDAAPAALTRAISNLLDNAVKWSPPETTIEVTVRGGAVTVRDHGPGIDPDDLPHVFDRFYRSKATSAVPGSGLGLAIVRKVAEAHRGTITAQGANGGGTSMTLRLPTADTEAQP
jgi:two-component system sensor histidine kinase MprB